MSQQENAVTVGGRMEGMTRLDEHRIKSGTTEYSRRHEPREDYEYDRRRRSNHDEFEEDYAPIRRERPERKEERNIEGSEHMHTPE